MRNKKRGLQKEEKNFFRSKLVLNSLKSKIAFFAIVFLFGVVISIGILDVVEDREKFGGDEVYFSSIEQTQLTVEEKNKINEAKKEVGESNGHDYSKLYEMLKEKKGNKGKLFAVCDDFGEPIFCLKKVSSENPEFRTEICNLLIIKIREEYQGKISDEKLNRFVEGHKKDCEFGIPQFSY